jgi:cold shock CspA family protein
LTAICNGHIIKARSDEEGREMTRGTIKRLDLVGGYGFIQTTGQERDLFFHRSHLIGVDFNSLEMGKEVEFEIGLGRGNRTQALKVRLAQPKTE